MFIRAGFTIPRHPQIDQKGHLAYNHKQNVDRAGLARSAAENRSGELFDLHSRCVFKTLSGGFAR